MKMKFNILPIAITAVLGAGMSSCNDWLRVDMEDKVMEKTMFRSEEHTSELQSR